MTLKYIIGIVSLFYISLTIYLVKNVGVETVTTVIASFGMLAPLAYIVLYTVRGFIRMPSVLFWTLAPLLFGISASFAIHLLAAALCTTIMYFFGRWLRNNQSCLREWRDKYIHGKPMEKKIKKYNILGIVFFQALLISYDGPNFISGYIKTKFVYVLATSLSVSLAHLCVYNFIIRGMLA